MENQVTNQNQETKTKSVILTDAPEKFPVIPFSVFCIGFAGTLYGTMPAGMLSFCLSFFVCFSSASALYHRSTPSRLVCLLTGGVSLLGCCILGTRTLLFDFTASFSAFRDGCVVYDGYHPVATCVFLVITFVLATWFSAYSIAKALELKSDECKAARVAVVVFTVMFILAAILLQPFGRNSDSTPTLTLNEWHQEAKKGDVYAQRMMGMIYNYDLYSKNYGVRSNDDLAIYWYQKAAAQGDEYSRKRLQHYAVYSDRPDAKFLDK